eukprot:CAMPEP_0113967994 /NCGR_PEP_ID=MMETSP0011_2-20120614/9255_1 /TAXON_ID=101924 /ORGANISM="Rhodosorus marinus" /LENGTH=1098 /DNA_ID=CAMNT_0000980971 /DNA_START=402 /DNA_END=3698 /DNA_ORIENTATION=+ /assembly_acc=CAM_ASM_000156
MVERVKLLGLILGILFGVTGALVFDAEDLAWTVVVEGDYQSMLDVDWIPGDVSRIVVCEKRGFVWLIIDGVRQSKPFLDISSEVVNFGARGLTACMVDADFENYPYFYVSYTDNRQKETSDSGTKGGIVARYKLSDDLTQAIDPVIVMGTKAPPASGCSDGDVAVQDIICMEDRSHNMGGLAMSPDGKIFIGVGDASSVATFNERQIRAQQLWYKTGKVHCITRTGLSCPGSPFIYENDRTTNRAKVWNLGVRNPFRIGYDPVYDIPLIANVGQATWESIWPGFPGLNFGWPCTEAQRTNLKASLYPICTEIAEGKIEIHPDRTFWDIHHDLGAAATGVVRLSSKEWPAELRNKIAVADYTNNWIKLIEVDRDGIIGSHIDFASEVGGPVQLKQGPDGWLYAVSILTQQVIRIEHRVNTDPPRVVRTIPPVRFKGAELTTDVSVMFSKKIDFSLVDGESVRITERSTGSEIHADYEWEPATNTVVARLHSHLDPNTDYDLVVSGIRDTGGRDLWRTFESTFKTANGFSLQLSDLDWISSSNGTPDYPEPFRDVQFPTFAVDVPPLMIRGQIFKSGIAMYARGEVEVAVPDGCTRFQAYTGVDDVVTLLDAKGVHFIVGSKSKDGAVSELYRDTVPRKRIDPPAYIDVDVTGAASLVLTVERAPEGARSLSISTWGSPKFRCGDYDQDKATVVWVRPTDRVTGLYKLDDSIRVRFSEPMDVASTMDATQILLPVALGGYIIGFSTRFSPDQRTMTVIPTEPLAPDTEYTLTIDTTAKDVSGNNLLNAFTRRIQTQAEDPSGETFELVDLLPEDIRPSSGMQLSGREILVEAPVEVDYIVPGNCGELSVTLASTEGEVRVTIKDPEENTICASELVAASTRETLSCNIQTHSRITMVITGGGNGVIRTSTMNCAVGSMLPRCEFGERLSTRFQVGDVVRLSAQCYDYKGALIPKDDLFWIVSLIHCQTICHRHEELTVGGVSEVEYEVEDHGDYFFLEIEVFAESDGRRGVSTMKIRPLTASVTVTSMPPGITVSSDSLSGPSPLRSITVVGSNFTINAVERENNKKFSFWDDNTQLGPSRFLQFTNAGPRSYNAVYEDV